MGNMFQKAKREKVHLKILLGAMAGGGKTYGSLRLATGIVSRIPDGKIAFLDTENGRGLYYSDKFDYDYLQLEAPYTPEKYIEAIDGAVDAGYSVLCLDSLSHEWAYLNQIHNDMPGNSFVNWGPLTKRHDAFLEKILQAPIHIIACSRAKDLYSQGEKNGKKTIERLGEGFEQRKNIEYPFTISAILNPENHVAIFTKDNTTLFDGRFEMLTEKHGQEMFDWANSGDSEKKNYVAEFKDSKTAEALETIDTIKQEIKDLFLARKDDGGDTEELYNLVIECGAPRNFMTIEDLELAKKVLGKVKGDSK